jgi:general secretion pathway protein G
MQSTIARLRKRQSILKDREGGFTLIELLIVIVILGILAAIVVFAVQNLTGQSKSAACQAQVKTVETAQETYKAQVGVYPTAYTDLTGTHVGLDGSTDGPWLKDVPPTSGPYLVTIDGNGNTQVQTVKASGAQADKPATTGTVNCAFA